MSPRSTIVKPLRTKSAGQTGDVIELTTMAARSIGVRAFELDWRIREASRGGALLYPAPPT